MFPFIFTYASIAISNIAVITDWNIKLFKYQHKGLYK